jgi:predicted RNA-binding protein with PUA-like domain
MDTNPKTEDMEAVDQDIKYWLMKAEPQSRIEKGVDVKFSIDDLAAKVEPEGWDGKCKPTSNQRNTTLTMYRCS